MSTRWRRDFHLDDYPAGKSLVRTAWPWLPPMLSGLKKWDR